MTPMISYSQRAKTCFQQMKTICKKIWRGTSLFSVLFSASLSLFIFVRWLDFFIVSTRSKVVIFGALFAFFFLLSIFFITPIIEYLLGKKKILIVFILIGVISSASLIALLPAPEYKDSTQILLTGLRVNDALVLILSIFAGLGTIFFFLKGKDTHYQIFLKNVQRYLLDYLIMAGILLVVAICVRVLKPESSIKTIFVLLPGLAFLIFKVIYYVMPSLPIIILSLTLSVNLLVIFGLFNTSLLTVSLAADQSFNQLAVMVNPGDPTLMSFGFYKQLRNSDLVLETGSILANEKNAFRLKQINLLNQVYILDYPGELSPEEAQRLLVLEGWSKWDRRETGSFYFYRTDLPVTSPIVIFTSQDNFFLVPSDLLDGLGLYDDFIFN